MPKTTQSSCWSLQSCFEVLITRLMSAFLAGQLHGWA